jgi:superfamily II DNA helicase RecQ
MDSAVIAGTGSGKTLPFALIHLVVLTRVTIVVSPLNALDADQVRDADENLRV